MNKIIHLSLFSLTFIITTKIGYSQKFIDVNEQTPQKASIEFLAENKIISGYGNGDFKPEQPINRAEMLKILVEAEILVSGNSNTYLDYYKDTECFLDLIKEEWYTKYICSAKALKIVEGYENGKYFKPEQSVTFVEALKMTLETFQIKYSPTKLWYDGMIKIAKDNDLIPITIDSYERKISRAEMADLIFRTIKFMDPSFNSIQ